MGGAIRRKKCFQYVWWYGVNLKRCLYLYFLRDFEEEKKYIQWRVSTSFSTQYKLGWKESTYSPLYVFFFFFKISASKILIYFDLRKFMLAKLIFLSHSRKFMVAKLIVVSHSRKFMPKISRILTLAKVSARESLYA